jgi:hypothetical protein
MESPRRWSGPVEKPFEPAPRPNGPREVAAAMLAALRETFVPTFPETREPDRERSGYGPRW